MPSDDDRSELLDDDTLAPEYPPDRPLGADEYGTTHQEERVDEPLEERVRRDQSPPTRADEPVLLLDETGDGPEESDLDEGETGSSVLGEVGDAEWAGDDAGPALGPPPSVSAADRVPLSAEEAAVHVRDEDERGRSE